MRGIILAGAATLLFSLAPLPVQTLTPGTVDSAWAGPPAHNLTPPPMVPPLGRGQIKRPPPPDRPAHLPGHKPGHKPGRKVRAYPYQRDTVVIHKHHYLKQPAAVTDEAAIPPPESSGATVVETWEFSPEHGAQMIDKEVHP